MSESYYEEVSAAFDRAAGSYHAEYAENPIQVWLDADTFSLLCRLFPSGASLLEIGCGNGEMAVRLAEAGRNVVATDISAAMIDVALARASGSPASSRLSWIASPAGMLTNAVSGPFDGAYSNFGPLNCEPDLAVVASQLGSLLRQGGVLACSVMNRVCAWEIGWNLLRLRPRAATRRLRRGWVQARMSGAPGDAPSTIPVRYYSPGEFARAFAPHFSVVAVAGFPVVIPPPYLAHRFPAAARRAGGIERRVRTWPLLRSIGDHFWITLRRN